MDVEIEDRTGELAMIALQGKISASVLGEIVDDLDLATVGYYRFAFGTVAGIPDVRISRTGYTGEDGFEIYFPDSEVERVWNLLLEVGDPQGLAPIGLGARDTLRLEAGMPLYGHEIDEEHNPVEAGLGFGISFKEEKGEWIGRAALRKVKESPRRKLMGLVTDGPRVPRQGYEILQADRTVGRVCSGAVSPTLETNIGTTYLPLELAEPDTALEMDVRGKRQGCRIVPLPFYKRTDQ
jgi:aminomethyltransferase